MLASWRFLSPKMKTALVVLTLLAHSTARSLIDDATPVNQAPFIMAHDTASGYLGDGLVNSWTKTQSVGMKEQLNCGARVFDARPKLDDSKGLVWHHGDVTVDYQL